MTENFSKDATILAVGADDFQDLLHRCHVHSAGCREGRLGIVGKTVKVHLKTTVAEQIAVRGPGDGIFGFDHGRLA